MRGRRYQKTESLSLTTKNNRAMHLMIRVSVQAFKEVRGSLHSTARQEKYFGNIPMNATTAFLTQQGRDALLPLTAKTFTPSALRVTFDAFVLTTERCYGISI